MLGNNLDIWFNYYNLRTNSEDYLNLLCENNTCIMTEDLRCLYIDLYIKILTEFNLLNENDIELLTENSKFIEATGYAFLLLRSGEFLNTRDNKNILVNN